MTQPHQPEAETPELERFLKGSRPRRLLGRELEERLHELLAPERPAELPEETLPHRIMVMWRIARVTAQVKGCCADEETLDEATEGATNRWTKPFKPVMTAAARHALRRERASRLTRIHSEGDGLPLLPPRDDSAALARWCEAASIIVHELGLLDTAIGKAGAEGLLDPRGASMCDVTEAQVLAFEELMIEEATNLLLDVGERATVNHYRDLYGFTRKETAGLLRLVKAQAMTRTMAAVEEKRALHEARLENFLSRARETMNMDDEMKALKELAKIQGLTRTAPEDQAAEFLEVIRRVSAKQDAAQELPTRTVKVLELHRGEEAKPLEIEATPYDPDDEEALAEFDRENER